MPIDHVSEQGHGSFVIARDGDRVANLTYRVEDDGTWVLTHTFVDEALRRQHVGEQLVERAIEEARKSGAEVRATCTFAKAVLERRQRS